MKSNILKLRTLLLTFCILIASANFAFATGEATLKFNISSNQISVSATSVSPISGTLIIASYNNNRLSDIKMATQENQTSWSTNSIAYSTDKVYKAFLWNSLEQAKPLTTSKTYKWTPEMITDKLTLWLDAQDENTFVKSGTTISQWNDKSGKGRNVTGNNSPQYVANGLNNKAAVSLGAGMSRYFSYDNDSTNWADFKGNISLYSVANLTGYASTFSQADIISLTNKTTSLSQYRLGINNTSGVGYHFRRINDTSANGTDMGTSSGGDQEFNKNVILGGTYDGSNIIAYQNSTAYASAPATGAINSINALTIGARRYTNTAGQYAQGSIGEVIAVNTVLTTDERQKLEGYLAWKWGMQDNLSSNHPYRYDGTLFGYYKLWSPTDLTASLWLDASDESTIINKSTSTGLFSQWNNKNDSSVYATINNSSGTALYNPPKHMFDGIYRGVYSTGTNIDRMVIHNNSLLNNDNLTVFTVSRAQTAVTGTDYQEFFGNRETSSTGRIWRLKGDNTLLINNVGGATPVTLPSIVQTNRNIITYTSSGASPSQTISYNINGSSTVTSATGAYTSDTNNRIYLFKNPGSTTGTPKIFNGYINEIIVFNSVLTSTDKQKIEGYLAWKWGTVSSLPADHPYKTTPPKK